MPNRVLQFLRGLASSKPALQDGQGYLEKDTDTFVIQNGGNEIRLSDQSSEITALQSGLATTNQTVGQLSQNVADINQQLEEMGGGGAQKVSATLGTSWSSSGSNFVQNINITGMTADAVPSLFPQWTSAKANEQTAWNSLTEVQSFAGYIQVTASARTTTPVNFIVTF